MIVHFLSGSDRFDDWGAGSATSSFGSQKAEALSFHLFFFPVSFSTSSISSGSSYSNFQNPITIQWVKFLFSICLYLRRRQTCEAGHNPTESPWFPAFSCQICGRSRVGCIHSYFEDEYISTYRLFLENQDHYIYQAQYLTLSTGPN